MDMFFTDTMEIADRQLDAETGFLAVRGRIARTGLYTYAGREVGKPHLSKVIVYRPEDAVFDTRAMRSFAHKPVTSDHPPEQVTKKNWRRYSRGQSGGQVARDGEFLDVPMLVADAELIADIEAGKVELSPGYTTKLVFEDGHTPEGEPYQARMTDINANHIAFVMRGRGGPECRIGDHYTPIHNQGASRTMADNLRTVVVDGFSISVTDQGAEAIAKLQQQLSDTKAIVDRATSVADALKATHATALEAKDGEIAGLRATHAVEVQAKDGEIDALKAQIPDAAALDALVAARSGVIAAARKVLGDSFDVTGQSDADLRRAAVSKRLGDKMPADAGDTFVSHAFTTLNLLGDSAAPDPVRAAIRQAPAPTTMVTADAAYNAMLERDANAWKEAK